MLGALPADGTVGDVGCGHGLLCALAAASPGRRLVGVDPDPAKIAAAHCWLGHLPNVELRVGAAADLPAGLDAVAICDVLYLLPHPSWSEVLAACRDRLRHGGRLVLKEADVVPAWKHRKALAQEWVMVNLLRRTRSGGGLHFAPRAETARRLESVGFRVDLVRDLGRGYSTAHVLFVATRT